MTLKVGHRRSAGFFSCCSVLLHRISDFKEGRGYAPESVDTSGSFLRYKNRDVDIRLDFFKAPIVSGGFKSIRFNHGWQCRRYSQFDFNSLGMYLDTYFNPTEEIERKAKIMSREMGASDSVGVYYRGTDKGTEFPVPSFKSMISKMDEVLDEEGDCRFIVQTDESGFLHWAKKRFGSRVEWVEENPRMVWGDAYHLSVSDHENWSHMKVFLPTVLMFSSCRRLIFNSSNVSLWMTMFRGHRDGVSQWLDRTWH